MAEPFLARYTAPHRVHVGTRSGAQCVLGSVKATPRTLPDPFHFPPGAPSASLLGGREISAAYYPQGAGKQASEASRMGSSRSCLNIVCPTNPPW